MKKQRNYTPTNALVRGLDVLAAVGSLGEAGVGALHKRTNIPKPTIVRNLETLEYSGYIARNDTTGLYSLTARVLSLSAGYDKNLRLVNLASPILNSFRETMPWPSDLAIFDTDAMVIVETNRDPGALALNRPVGTRLPLLASALGRAFLAFCSDQLRATALDKYFADHPELSDGRVSMEKALAKYQTQGFSENDQSLSKNTRGVGVPVIVNGTVEACINTIVLCEAMTMQEVVDRCVPPLISVAKEISIALLNDRDGTGEVT